MSDESHQGLHNVHGDPVSTQMPSGTNSNNGTLDEITSSLVLYYGLNGFGVSWSYFLINIVLVIVAGTGIFLNTLALKIVSVKSPFHDASHNFISHLAKSDLVIGVICIFNALYNLIHYKNYYECALRSGIATCVALNSSIHLLFLTFDRHFKIMHPYKYYKYFSNEERLNLISRCMWLFAGILGVLPILGWRRPPIHGFEYCSYFGVLDRGYLMLMFGLFFGIMLVMFYCYISILWVAWNQRRKLIKPHKTWESGYNHRNTKALWWGPTKTVMILITLYCCCWLPTAVVVLFHLTDLSPASYTDDQKGVIVSYVTALVYLNIVANPLIYVFKIRRRRKQSVRCMVNIISSQAKISRQKLVISAGSRCLDAFELSEALKATTNQ